MSLTYHRRANLSVQTMLQVLAEHGKDPSSCLEGTHLTPANLLSSETKISDDEEIRILEKALAELPKKAGYGVRSGGTFHATTYGAWGLAIMSSPTVREAMEVGVRYSAPFMLSKLSMHTEASMLKLAIDMEALPDSIRLYIFERVYATYMIFIRDMLPGQDRSVFELHLPIEDEIYGQELAEITGKTVRLGSPGFAIVTPQEWLAQAMPQADAIAHSHFKQQLQSLLNSKRELPDHAQMIRDHMIDANRFSPQLEEVAAKAGLSGRSFRRRLQEEGTSFKEIVLSTKMTIAKELLSTAGLSVNGTAHRLGYSEAASFSRAYSRWWGHNPGQAGREGTPS